MIYNSDFVKVSIIQIQSLRTTLLHRSNNNGPLRLCASAVNYSF